VDTFTESAADPAAHAVPDLRTARPVPAIADAQPVRDSIGHAFCDAIRNADPDADPDACDHARADA
jgi:hypothetical protein